MAEGPAARDRTRAQAGSGENILSGAPAEDDVRGSRESGARFAVSSRSDADLPLPASACISPAPERSCRITDA